MFHLGDEPEECHVAGVCDDHVGDGAEPGGELGALYGVDASRGARHREADHAEEDGADDAGECWVG